jgi:hypothetical protein
MDSWACELLLFPYEMASLFVLHVELLHGFCIRLCVGGDTQFVRVFPFSLVESHLHIKLHTKCHCLS